MKTIQFSHAGRWLVVALASLPGLWAVQTQRIVAAAELSAGIAVIDITPPVGYRMSGYFRERLGTGTLNTLHAKALVMAQGSERVAMVFCDIIGIAPSVSNEVRKRASAKTGIPAANILIAATHSHTGPLYFGALRNFFHDRALATHGRDPCETVDYPAQLANQLVQVLEQAQAAMEPVQITAGTTDQLGLTFNRRFHMRDGPVRFNPGVLNPNIIRPAGPIDPEVGMVFVRDASGTRTVAGLVNFALHLDTLGGTRYAADYPFHVEQCLRQSHGQDFVLLFGTGTCGDINHINVQSKDRLTTEAIGKTLGETVRAAVPELQPVIQPALAARHAIVNLQMQTFEPSELEQAHQNMAKVGTRELPFLEQVEAYKILALAWRGGAILPLDVQVFRLSQDVAIVGLPGEIFVELGLTIKETSPFATTLVIELCNDAPGYIPTRKAFAEGSYETVNSRIAPGGGEELVATAQRLLRELKE